MPTISTLVSAMVPSDNMLVRMHAGALAGEAFRYTIKKTSTLSSWIPTLFRTNQLFISQGTTDERHANPVFEQMQEFIVAKHFSHLTTAQLIPKKGEITLYPRQGLKLTETFQGHKLDIAMTYGPTEEGNPDVTKVKYHTQIVLSSRTLKVEQLKEFVQTICKLDRVLHSTIVVYRPIVQRGKRDESTFVEWDKIFMKTNKTLENTIYSETVIKQLFDDVEWFMQNEEWFKTRGMSYKRGYVMHGPPGIGKCLGKGTPVLMWDGSTKLIEDVIVGDVLVGDNSTPRIVQSLGHGQDQMYKIRQLHADDYIVNSEHILTLHISGNRSISMRTKRTNPFRLVHFDHTALRFVTTYFSSHVEATQFSEIISSQSPNTIDINLRDFMKLDQYTQQHLKGFKVNVEWPEQPVEIDPYTLGYWIGDGSKDGPVITTQEPEVVKYFTIWCQQQNMSLVYRQQESRCPSYYMKGQDRNNPFLKFLQKQSMINNKHIPLHYKRNSRKILLQLLAGIIDADGHKVKGECQYEVTQKSETLAKDIQFICHSLGFKCSMKYKEKTCTNSKNGRVTNWYFILFISGHGMEDLPLQCSRKRVQCRTQKKNPLVTCISVEPVGYGDYYGVTLNDNERFLLGDFTVTHNTSVAKILANKYHLPIFVLDLQSLESNSDFNKLVTEINYLTDQRYIISIEDLDRTEMFRNKWYGDNGKCVSVQCFLNFLDGVVETHGRICIFSANDMSVLDNHPSSTAMFRPGRIDCRIEITHCNKTQLSKLFQLYYGEDVSEDTIKTTAVISPAQFLNIMTKCTQTEVLDYLQSNEKADLASDADLAIQGLLGEGGAKEGNGIKRKRCSNRGRCAKHRTPLARIKQKQRDLDRMEKAIQSSIKKSDKIRESLMVQVEKMAEDKTKVTQKEEALLAQQKEGYSVVKASSRGVVLKRSRVK